MTQFIPLSRAILTFRNTLPLSPFPGCCFATHCPDSQKLSQFPASHFTGVFELFLFLFSVLVYKEWWKAWQERLLAKLPDFNYFGKISMYNFYYHCYYGKIA